MATVWLAFTNDDALVRDDYYREGLAINRRLDDGARARAAGLAAELRYERATRAVELRLQGADDDLQRVVLTIEHPTDATRDENADPARRRQRCVPRPGKHTTGRQALPAARTCSSRRQELAIARHPCNPATAAVRVTHLDTD
jgi:hypothetical protein